LYKTTTKVDVARRVFEWLTRTYGVDDPVPSSNPSRSWSLGDSEQYVCMDFFSTTWIESVSFHIPSGVDCQRNAADALCRLAPPGSRQGIIAVLANLREHWQAAMQSRFSTPNPRGRPQNPQAFCGDCVGIAWRRRAKYPLDRHCSVLVRRYICVFGLIGPFLCLAWAHFVWFPDCNTAITTSVTSIVRLHD
jgi:hypothetical protein